MVANEPGGLGRWRLSWVTRGAGRDSDVLNIAVLVSVGPFARSELRRLLDEAEKEAKPDAP